MSHTKINQEAQNPKIGLWPRLAAAAFVVVMSLAVCTGTAFSQDDQGASAPPAQGGDNGGHKMGGHRQMPTVDEQLQHLNKKLNLSDDQQTKVKAVLEDQRTKMEALRNDASTSREDRFPKMREIHENSNTQIKAILNEDQQKKFDKIEQEQHERMGHQGPPPASN
jgi:periplasmic protein CpxP/Spy